jgi:hypothetical protein
MTSTLSSSSATTTASHHHCSASGGACSDKGDAAVNGVCVEIKELPVHGMSGATNASIALHLATPLVISVVDPFASVHSYTKVETT